MTTFNRKSLVAGVIGTLFALALSWMFVEGTRVEMAQRDSGYGHVTLISALVR